MRAFVKQLRQKLGDDAASPAWIFNVRGVGYRMPARRPIGSPQLPLSLSLLPDSFLLFVVSLQVPAFDEARYHLVRVFIDLQPLQRLHA